MISFDPAVSSQENRSGAIANLLGEAGDSESLRKVLRALTLNLKHFQEIIFDSGIKLHFDERDQVSELLMMQRFGAYRTSRFP